MKGRLIRSNGEWKVSYIDSLGTSKLLPLHPYDEQIMEDQEKVFDDVEFGIEMFWETGIEEPFETALLVMDDEDWDVTLNDGLEGL
jgi:hypothetical protein